MEIALQADAATAPHSPGVSWCWQQPHPEPPPRWFEGTGYSKGTGCHGQEIISSPLPAAHFTLSEVSLSSSSLRSAVPNVLC